MPDSPDSNADSFLKWPVIFALVAIMVMIGSYDLMIAGFVGAAFAAIGLIALWIRIRLATGPDEPASERDVMGDRFLRSSYNRQLARVKESGVRSRPQRRQSDRL
ncbi:hypothetical protein [Erythrobacter rubeus]|uniref:Uncharacterized protein n=1 Tax=Erythrobacter rubeus TaxID=2760803 RepID=A0ABR8KT92_9SPHN|nr:hypothetical protein [Erythrobacter rubeus]MBD2842820.1 hypothetical protein [Erythrobacter rubeus]